MLTDTKHRNLKPRDKIYKVNDRDGLYVAVTKAGAISFRHNYSIKGGDLFSRVKLPLPQIIHVNDFGIS